MLVFTFTASLDAYPADVHLQVACISGELLKLPCYIWIACFTYMFEMSVEVHIIKIGNELLPWTSLYDINHAF